MYILKQYIPGRRNRDAERIVCVIEGGPGNRPSYNLVSSNVHWKKRLTELLEPIFDFVTGITIEFPFLHAVTGVSFKVLIAYSTAQ